MANIGSSSYFRMDDGFQTMFDFVEEMKREMVKNKKALTEPLVEEDQEEKCEHEGIETEEALVCCKCGLVLDNIYLPDVHWFDHAQMERSYTSADRLNAVDKALVKFIEKIGYCTNIPLNVIEDRVRAMKIESGFKSLNYALAVMCVLDGDAFAQDRIRPFLPRSNVAWARSLRLLSPVPGVFMNNWLRNLLEPRLSKDLSERQKKRFYANLERFDNVEHQTMQDLIARYDRELDWSTKDLEKIPIPLRHALHRFSMAVCKPK